ncbi:MAG: NUDIX domain-containing protein [Mycobacteriales bacterium]
MEEHRFCPRCGAALVPDGRAQRCTGCGRPHFRDPKVAVGVVARDPRGRLLMVQRSRNPQRGLWSLPGGFVDADEDPRAAAARECLEETGLVVEVGRVLEAYPSTEGSASFFLAFAARVTGGTLAAGDDAADAGFFEPDALPPLAFESTRAAVSDAGA